MDLATIHLIIQDFIALCSLGGIGTMLFKLVSWKQHSDDRHVATEKRLGEHDGHIKDLYGRTEETATILANTRGKLGLNGG